MNNLHFYTVIVLISLLVGACDKIGNPHPADELILGEWQLATFNGDPVGVYIPDDPNNPNGPGSEYVNQIYNFKPSDEFIWSVYDTGEPIKNYTAKWTWENSERTQVLLNQIEQNPTVELILDIRGLDETTLEISLEGDLLIFERL